MRLNFCLYSINICSSSSASGKCALNLCTTMHAPWLHKHYPASSLLWACPTPWQAFLPPCLFGLLADTSSIESRISEDLPGSPRFRYNPFNIMPLPKIPVERVQTRHFVRIHAAFQRMQTVGLCVDDDFGTYSIHFRCGLIPHISGLHSIRYFLERHLVNGLVANLYPQGI